MHGANYEFLNEVKPKYPKYFSNCKVLELGSRNIQGGGRLPFKSYFDNCEYIGIDRDAGEGVDFVVRAQDTVFPDKYFDTILCFSLFEHDPDWKIALSHNLPFVKNGGMLFLAWGAEGNRPHKPDPFRVVPEREFLDFVKTLPVEVIDSYFENTRYKKPVRGGYVAILKVKRKHGIINIKTNDWALKKMGIIYGVGSADTQMG